MEHLQQKYNTKRKTQPFCIQLKKAVRQKKGFISFILLPFTTLFIVGMMGVSSLSLGIKNITQSQSYCIQTNLQGQKKLGVLLNKILSLNNKSLFLHQTRKKITLSIPIAITLGQFQLVSVLRKKIEFIKAIQNGVIAKQNLILIQSHNVKIKMLEKLKTQLKKFKILYVKETTFYKKALAIKKQKIGDRAYIYKPVPDFTNYQKTSLEWSIQPFSPLLQNLKWILPLKQTAYSTQSCTSSLTQKGKTWINHLYH